MRRVSAVLDRVLAVAQWPVAVLALVALPGAVLAFGEAIEAIARRPAPLGYFAAGAAAYLVAFEGLLKRTWFGTYFSTLEHELTHAAAALATFHPVRGLRVTRHQGGHVQIVNGTNWLISLAPYFVPSLTLVLLAAFEVAAPRTSGLVDAVLGASFAYHLASTLRETHARQPDFRAANRVFALLFLPAANVVVIGVLVAVALTDASVGSHLERVGHHTRALFARIP